MTWGARVVSVVLFCGSFFVVGCANSGGTTMNNQGCTPGASQMCMCGDLEGIRTCRATREYGSCTCRTDGGRGDGGSGGSDVGTTGDVGTTASDVGTTASDVGTNMSDVGASSGDVGTMSSDVGTNMSDVGTTPRDSGSIDAAVVVDAARVDAATAPIDAGRDAGPCASCGAGSLCCSDACTDVLSNNAHCGGCGIVCGSGLQCMSGQCRTAEVDAGPAPVDAGPACGGGCGSGADCCNGSCTALNTTTNCGACGVRCGAGESCCGGVCTNTGTDYANCGACGNACSESRTSQCLSGACSCGTRGSPCSILQICFFGSCQGF